MYKLHFFQFLCGLLLGNAHARSVPQQSTVVSTKTVRSTKYDFVIAGGGIAGLTLADRLTEDPRINVLVIEAGPFDKREDSILIPGDWDPNSFFPAGYFWPGLETTPLTALNNRTSPVLASRVVGGGSTLNAMNWIRGTIADFEGWESLGNEGWGWHGILPFFKKSENFTAPDPTFASKGNISFDNSVRGHHGPVQYSYPDYFYPGSANWWDAGLSIGMEKVEDANGGVNSGLFWPPTVINATTQTRCDARIAHYDRVIDSRPNYHILTEMTVSRVLFQGKRATGVEYFSTISGHKMEQKMTVQASKEIIIAAGGIFAPQLLQVSGIGPKALLDSLKIPVVSDLPGVGSNLQDQTTLPVPYNFSKLVHPNGNTFANNHKYNGKQLQNYNSHKTSAYTIVRSLGLTFGALALQQVSGYKKIVANAKAYSASKSLPTGVDATVLAGYKAQRKIIIEQFQNPNIATGITLWDTGNVADVFSLKPLSRGSVMINSSSIIDLPIIDYRTATDPTDFDIIVAYLRKTRELFSAAPMQVMGPIQASPLGPDVHTDEQIIAVARKTLVATNAHQCCTTPMLPLKLGGVLCRDQKVYGVQGLRVAGVSSFPLALSAGPTPTVYAAAEKLAMKIKREYCLS